MPIRNDDLKHVLSEAQRPVGVKELIRLAGLHPGQQTDLKRALRELLRAGQIQKEGKRFYVPGRRPRAEEPRPVAGKPKGKGGLRSERGAPREPARFEKKRPGGRFEDRGFERRGGPRREGKMKVVEGILKVHRDGFGFVDPISGEGESVFLPPPQVARALDNDRVRVEVPDRPGRVEGRLLEIVSRRREHAVGIYRQRGAEAWVEPTDSSLPNAIRVPPTQIARDGDLVKVRLGVGQELVGPGEGLVGEVAGSLGKPGDPSAEVLSIAFAKGFNDEFPPEVMDEADRVPLEVPEEDATADGRRDLRGIPLVTIDGQDARDFDDAVWAERQGSGWRLVVAIADVTHYVRTRAPLDAEAFSRATSVYLPDRVLPMLPERLSNGICSLRPDVDRLCMVADMQIDGGGKLTRYQLYPGVMKSAARCTYEEVQAVLDGEDVPHRNHLKPQFEELKALALALHQMRIDRGAIDFDLPEHKVLMGEDGRPVRMVKRERKFSHRLIEECMLAANEAVAKFFQDQGLPSIYRFHGEPDEEKLIAFSQLAEMHGFYLGDRGEISSKDLNTFISKLEGHPEKRALNQLLLRSMMQAIYSAENVGHYGLAAEHYLHFTSPIRRYPDLIVHRLLKEHWARKSRARAPDELERETERLERMAEQCSERERAAVQVEREVVSFYAALLMEGREGEEFWATVAGVADFGFFVEIDEEFIEGLVKAETVGPGGKLDAKLHALVYPGGRRVRVGQRVQVRLVSVSRARRQIDFEAIAFEGEARLPGAGEEGSSVDFVQRFKRKAGTKGFVPGRERPARRGGGEAPVRRGGGKSFERPAGRGRAQEPEAPKAFERPGRRGAAEELETPKRFERPARRGAAEELGAPKAFERPVRRGPTEELEAPERPVRRGPAEELETPKPFERPARRGQGSGATGPRKSAPPERAGRKPEAEVERPGRRGPPSSFEEPGRRIPSEEEALAARRVPAAAFEPPGAPREEEETPSASPHPGFDRLRALAAKKGLLSAPKQGRSERSPAKGGAKSGPRGKPSGKKPGRGRR